VIISLGLAPVFTATTDLIVGSAPPERAGAASGISETGAELGGALGIAILGSIGTAVYRAALADQLPQGVPSDAVAAARDTLGAAVEAAQELPAPLGGELLTGATDAFILGMRESAAVATVDTIRIAQLTVTFLRHVRGASQEEPAERDTAAVEDLVVEA
jgi:DHA2 family multidrug resistance protein-like MFS transporter